MRVQPREELKINSLSHSMKKISTTILFYGLYSLICCCFFCSSLNATENSECLDCHSDESITKESTDNILNTEITESLYVDEDAFNHSIHNINGVTCVDCHSDIEELDYDNDVPHATYLKAVCCASCHEEAGDEFKNSVHMKMNKKGITMTCYACHGYHYVKPMEGASVAERQNSICLKCHNPYQYHDWLPSGEAHFSLVECVVCHAPDVPRHIILKFYDLVTDQFYNSDEIIQTIGLTYENFMATIDQNKDDIINLNEFEDLVFMLKQKNIRAIFHAELVADISSIAHHINRGSAEKTCQNCHSSDSPYFNAVSIVMTRNDGSVEQYDVERSVLQSYYVSHFYLLGGTRMKLLDEIGMYILIIGAGITVVHLTLRLLTAPIRSKRDTDGDTDG